MRVPAFSRNSKMHSCCLLNSIELFKLRKASKFPKPNLSVPGKFKHISAMSVTVRYCSTVLRSLLSSMVRTVVFMF